MPDDAIADDDLPTGFGPDDTAWEKLADRYDRLVWLTAYRILRNDDEAQDVRQEVFLRLGRVLRRRGFPGAIRNHCAFLMAITRRRCFTRLKARRKTVSLDQPARTADGERTLGETLADPQSPAPPAAAEEAESLTVIRQAVARLAPREQCLYQLRYVAGLSHEEIAGLVDKSPGAVKTQLCRLHWKLHEALKGYFSNE